MDVIRDSPASASTKANMPPYNNQFVPMQQPQLGSSGHAENVYPSPIKQMGYPAYAEV
jgi:hypothetical protein